MQRANCGRLRDIIATARRLGLNSISFLAADVTSEAFNRLGGWPAKRQYGVALGPAEVAMLDKEVESVVQQHADDIASGFVVESAEKLRRIVRHFRAQLAEISPVAPKCNAPWVSAVIDADGTVRPCFFHPPVGNVREKTLLEILNGDVAVEFRGNSTFRATLCVRGVSAHYTFLKLPKDGSPSSGAVEPRRSSFFPSASKMRECIRRARGHRKACFPRRLSRT